MTDFRKILGFAAMATVFAGASYGQTVSCPGQSTPTFPNLYLAVVAGIAPAVASPASPLLLRAEGTTELVSDVVLTGCTATTTTASAALTVFMSQPVTSKPIGTATPQLTEATLLVTPTSAGAPSGATVPYSGVVNGSAVTFTGILFPSTFSMEVANVRVNATGTGATSAPVAVTETLFGGYNGLNTLNIAAVTVGTALQSLVAPAFTLAGSPPSAVVNNAVICTGNAVSVVTGLPTVSFSINVAEVLGGFFKSGVAVGGGSAPSTEYGTFVNTATGAGVPTSGTRIQLAMGGIPAAATVYLPVSITAPGSKAVMQLTSGTTGGFSQVSPVTSPTSLVGVLGGGVAAFTASNGNVTAVYEITTSDPTTIQSFPVPVYVTFTANLVTASQVTVLESYAPTGSTQIPNFAASAATPLNANTITACVTNLLFPFVTSQLGFDTGLAISNTSSDPFGKYGAVPPGTTAPAGACTLNYYGAGAPSPAAVATPSIASGTTYAFVNSSVAPGFQGYVIVQCPFIGGHGFGFVTNLGSAGNSAVAQGYNALSMPAANSSGTKRIFPSATNTEGLPQ